MDGNTSSCANCGKGEENSITLKKCGACKMVKYCSSSCQKAHRPQHKKECKKRAVELHEEALFKQPPLEDDCPICFLRMPTLVQSRQYMSCCGKVICSGCIVAVKKRASICPFCRTVAPSSQEESIERMKKRSRDANDTKAMYNLGCYYLRGSPDLGVPKDSDKALELWQRASELGCAEADYNIGFTQFHERDLRQAINYYELASMGGHALARHNLGKYEEVMTRNKKRALKHFMIAVTSGWTD